MSASSSLKPFKWLSNKKLPKLSLRCTPSKKPGSSNNSSSSTGKPGKDHCFREAFRHFDSDGDGKISAEELRAFLASWAGGDQVLAREAENVMRDLDSDGDGLLDYADFVRLMEGGGSVEVEEEDLKSAFEMFEVEKGCGFITPGGLQRVLARLGEARSHEECAAMIRAYDLDGNGVLDYEEFQQMMN